MKKQLMIFVDRDATLVYDKIVRPKHHLGRQKNWKSKVGFIKSAVQGLKLLRKEVPEAKIYVISNQSGVAIKEFPLLTEKRAHEVFQYILKKLENHGVSIDGYELCMKASPSYVKSHPQFTFDKRRVGNFACRKPNTGMIKSILRKEKLKRRQVKIYVIGDRASDVKTGLNAGGFGILVPFRERKQVKKLKEIKNKKKYVVRNFLDAARFIIKREKFGSN